MKLALKTCLALCLGLMMSLAQAADKAQRNFQQILDSGELRIGVAYSLPWVLEGANGELRGFDIEMAKRIAKDMQLDAKFNVYDWQQLLTALEQGEVDMIASGLSITPERALRVNFSNSYSNSGVSLAANKAKTAKISSLDGMNKPEIKLAMVKGTVSADVGQRVFPRADVQLFASDQQAEQALLKGEVHAFVTAKPKPRFLALRYPNTIDEPMARPLLGMAEAFAVRKGDADFVHFLNAWIVARSADFWIDSTRRYWFESLQWQETK